MQRKTLRPPTREKSVGAPTLVWIDDCEPVLNLYKALFELSGFHVLTASRGSAGLELVRKNQVDAVVTDYEMPGMNGGVVATSIKQSCPKLPVIMFSGSSAIPSQISHVVDAFCDKSDPRENLLAVIHKLIGNKPYPLGTPSGEQDTASRLSV